MRDLAKECGHDMTPVQLTIDELKQLRSTVVCHIERNLHESEFILWIGHIEKSDQPDSAILLSGDRVVVHDESIDLFRREWSGYALVPATNRQSNLTIAIWIIQFAFTYLIVIVFFQHLAKVKP